MLIKNIHVIKYTINKAVFMLIKRTFGAYFTTNKVLASKVHNPLALSFRAGLKWRASKAIQVARFQKILSIHASQKPRFHNIFIHRLHKLAQMLAGG